MRYTSLSRQCTKENLLAETQQSTNNTITTQSTDQKQIVILEDEGARESMLAPIQHTNTNSQIVKSTTKEDRKHNIPDFLNRLYQIDNFIWAKTSTRGEVLKTYTLPDILLTNPAINAKIRNFFGFRAGVELTVLVNKQPFQAGNLMISFLPHAKYNIFKSSLHSDKMGIVSRSGSPRTNLDLMDGTKATLLVPYASPFVYYNLLTKTGNIGNFYISVYSPLSDEAASGTVSVQVMARFVDIDLEFPTGILPTASSPIEMVRNSLENFSVNPSREVISEAKRKLDKLLKALDKGELVHQMNTQCINIKQKALPNMTNSNGQEHAHTLSLDANNSLQPMNIGQAGPNEMDFKHIMSIPCFHNSFAISTSQAAGTNVFSTLVAPTVLPNVSTTNSLIPTDYLTFIAQAFRKWRGSIKYHFRVVKTQFHSLRIRVWFCPGATSATGVDRDSVISKIIDLKELNRFEFEVPYVWPQPWLNTVGPGDVSLGVLGIDVLNAMVAPSSVSSSIDVIVERSMGTDFSFNLPTTISSMPFDISTIPPPTIKKKRDLTVLESLPLYKPCYGPDHNSFCCRIPVEGFYHQMNVAPQSDQDSSRTMGDDTSFERPTNSNIADGFTMGQNINNVNQLIKRSTKFLRTDFSLPFDRFDYTLTAGAGTIVLDEGLSTVSYAGTAFVDFSNTVGSSKPVVATRPFVIKPNLTGNIYYQLCMPGNYIAVTSTETFIYNDKVSGFLVTLADFTIPLETTAFPTVVLGARNVYPQHTVSLFPHTFPFSYFDAESSPHIPTYDTLTYFSSLYTFYRGGMNFRFDTSEEPYAVSLNPELTGIVDTTRGAAEITQSVYPSCSSLITQLVAPKVEGFGEIHIPYYAQSFCTSITGKANFTPTTEISQLTMPETALTIQPLGEMTRLDFFRAAGTDFEFSYLSGPPLLRG